MLMVESSPDREEMYGCGLIMTARPARGSGYGSEKKDLTPKGTPKHIANVR